MRPDQAEGAACACSRASGVASASRSGRSATRPSGTRRPLAPPLDGAEETGSAPSGAALACFAVALVRTRGEAPLGAERASRQRPLRVGTTFERRASRCDVDHLR